MLPIRPHCSTFDLPGTNPHPIITLLPGRSRTVSDDVLTEFKTLVAQQEGLTEELVMVKPDRGATQTHNTMKNYNNNQNMYLPG